MTNSINFVAVIGLCIASSFSAAVLLTNAIYTARKRKILAYHGDANAAKRLILPCYDPLFIGLLLFYSCFIVALSLTFSVELTNQRLYNCIQYYCFSLIGVYFITPVLLIQSSVSMAGFWSTSYFFVRWWLTCSLFYGFQFINEICGVIFGSLFLGCSALFPFCVSIGILAKIIPSRVQVRSTSNRNSVELLLVYSLLFGTCYTIGLSYYDKLGLLMSVVMVFSSIASNTIFPFALYRTLLADTKFWRGLGTHNKDGFAVVNNTGEEIHRPTIDMNVASSSLQNMMSEIQSITVDFAFLQLEKSIGKGSSSTVFYGKFKRKNVAIKLSTPPEITEEAIKIFVSEAKIASSLNHPNIVQFIGLCIRPPQIAMILEFCEGGNLKSNLRRHAYKWTQIMKLRACCDCTKAIEYLHDNLYIHRDLKAENFFVTRKGMVKLGDFGESTKIRNHEANINHGKRMTVVGTVAFMAPELIAANKYYDEKIDIYALAVTFWEIQTGGQDPYDGINQFEIYDKVAEGYRPPIPNDCPGSLKDILEEAWIENSDERPEARDILIKLESVLEELVQIRKASNDHSEVIASTYEDTDLIGIEESQKNSENPILDKPDIESNSGNSPQISKDSDQSSSDFGIGLVNIYEAVGNVKNYTQEYFVPSSQKNVPVEDTRKPQNSVRTTVSGTTVHSVVMSRESSESILMSQNISMDLLHTTPPVSQIGRDESESRPHHSLENLTELTPEAECKDERDYILKDSDKQN